MQINRLLEMVYILLDKKQATAKELAERFEVSQRTIYRDIETLSTAGIPVYTNKGKGGGISLLDSFVLSKSMLSEEEQLSILSSLQGLKALSISEVEPVLKKLAIIFNKPNKSWIDVDFSSWGGNANDKEKFNIVKRAILDNTIVVFEYVNSYGESSERVVEPLKILFKGQGWYFIGYCRTKGDFRIFKLTRIKKLNSTRESFKERTIPQEVYSSINDFGGKLVSIRLRISENVAYRVYDEFNEENIEKNKDGSLDIKANFLQSEWLYGYILSYGSSLEVLEPKDLRDEIKHRLDQAIKNYL